MEWIWGGRIPYFYALMRIVVGLLFVCHGAQKLFGVLGGFRGQSGMPVPLFSLMGGAGLIEFVGGLFIAFGFLASYAAFIASGEMAVAYFMQHFPRGFWPIQNGGELAVLYCCVFLFIAARGAGPWSVSRFGATSEPTPMQKAERHASSLSQ